MRGYIRLSLDSDVLQNHHRVKHCVICHNRKKYYQEKEIYIKDIGGTIDDVFKFSCLLNTETFLTDFLSFVPLTKAECVTFYDIAKIILPRTTSFFSLFLSNFCWQAAL